MLPERLLDLEFHDDIVVPKFLTSDDRVWVSGLIAEMDSYVGRPGHELDGQAGHLAHACKRFGASFRAAQAVLKVLGRTWSRRVMAAARPAEIRKTLFEHAGRGALRRQALECAAADLGISPKDLLDGLFADLPSERRIIAPENAPSPEQVIQQFNLGLVQGLLARSERVAALVRGDIRSVVRFAKLRGLLCTFTQDAPGTMLELSGPLSLFRHTTKYGNALAQFFPVLAMTPGWSLVATCLLRPPSWLSDEGIHADPRRYRLELDSSIPVVSTHPLPSEEDSAAERRLMRDVKRLQRGWSIRRETTALSVGSSVLFPDFRLERGRARVLVELVGYHTPEYLITKLEKLERSGVSNVLVCVDESLACDDGSITANALLRYSKRVDAGVLLDAAEELLACRSTMEQGGHAGDPFRAPHVPEVP